MIILRNNQVVKLLSEEIIKEIFSCKDQDIHVGPLEINDFSICFWIEVGNAENKKGVYIKIPKLDLYRKTEKNVFPLSKEDEIFGQNEYESLSYLSMIQIPSDLNSAFVKPVCFIKKYNAIVTEKVYGTDILHDFRRCALRRIIYGEQSSDLMTDRLYRLGRIVSCYHKNFSIEKSFETNGVLEKIHKYYEKLEPFSPGIDLLPNLTFLQGFAKDAHNQKTITKTLKGLDVRNILSDKNGQMLILDPGKMKDDCREADLARFIVTCRIIYWGSMLFFLHISPDYCYEKNFLKGYYGSEIRRGDIVLSLFMLKELLKHWYMAHIALDLKTWPTSVKTLLKKSYIDPFYKRQLFQEVSKLDSER